MKSSASLVISKLFASIEMFEMLRTLERLCTQASLAGSPEYAGLEHARKLVEQKYEALAESHAREHRAWEHEVKEAMKANTMSPATGRP